LVELWNLIILQPVINTLIVLSHYLFGSFGLAIIALTIIVNGLMLQLTLKQIRATKAMQTLQPKMAELQKKYAKDRQKLAQEQMSLYKESGMSPAGCLLPMLIQLPVWIALFQSIIKLLAATPEDFLGLSQYLYSWPVVHAALPLQNQFLWLDLATGNFVLALLVGGTMWLSQKMTMTSTADSRQQSMNTMMLWMMPMMFAFLSLTFPSGLALYWVTSNVIRIVIQYYIAGWGSLTSATGTKQVRVIRDKKYKQRIAEVEEAPLEDTSVSADIAEQEEELAYEETGDKRQDSRGGYPTRLREIRRKPRKGRGHHPKRG